MGVDVFDIVSVILGVWFTLRKLDAQGREAGAFPHVAEAPFLDWQEREVAVYRFAVWVCFGKAFVDLGFTYLVAPSLAPALTRVIGATIDLSWLGALVVTFFRSRVVHRRRRELGIVLGGFVVERDEEGHERDAD